jgi:hypothetical protein
LPIRTDAAGFSIRTFQKAFALIRKGESMTAQLHYDNLDTKQRQGLLLSIGETREEAQLLSQRHYVALGGWVKTRLKKHWAKTKA